MLRIKELQSDAAQLSIEEYIEKYPFAVLVARKMLGGLIRQRTEDTKSGVKIPSLPAKPTGNRTMVHMEAMQVEEEMDPGDSELVETRPLAREFVFPLQKKDGTEGPITIGRTVHCDIVINDYTISKRHAMFVYDPRVNRNVLADAGSTNGTAVGTRNLKMGERCSVESGYWITLGRMLCQYFVAADFYKFLQAKNRA